MSQQLSYYAFQRRQVQVGADEVTVVHRAALGDWQESITPALLLAEWTAAPPNAQVLHLHCDSGLAGAAIARRVPGSQVTLLDAHAVAVQTARLTLETNGVSDATVTHSDCGQAVHGRVFDVVAALLPKGRAVWEQTILDAAHGLHTGGAVYLAGANKSGIKSAARFLKEVFGNVAVLAYRGGCRVVRALKGQETAALSSDYYAWREIQAQVGDQSLSYVTKPGIFSWQQLDDGTRLLVEALQATPLRPEDDVLDVGCGSGVLTLLAARQAHRGHTIGVDVDCRAVEATQRTLALNQVENAQVMRSDCGYAVRDRTFTAVITNPPFHRERATTLTVAEQIIREATQLLVRRGRLYLVANSFLPYRPIIENAFGEACVLRETGRFKVWYAVKTR